MKTIKQIADELGVSKTAIRKKIDNLGLRSSLQKNGNQLVINEEQERLIKMAFSDSTSQTESETSSQTESETVSALVSMLRKELEEKNEQIKQYLKLLDQEQQLRMVAEQRVLFLEDKQENVRTSWFARVFKKD